MIIPIAIAIVVLLAGLLIYAATRPDSFRVQRSKSIEAPPEKVYDLIQDFHKWGAWSPWEKLDPALKRTFSGPSSGRGAVYAWEGNSKAGQGRMEITDAVPGSKVTIKLDFLKPFEAHNTAEFTLEPNGRSTKVNWAMFGSQPYMVKVMSIFCSMDGIVGKDFEKGLASMKAAAEGQTAPASIAKMR